MKKLLLTLFLTTCVFHAGYADDSVVPIRKLAQTVSPKGWDNYMWGVMLYNDKNVYYGKGTWICSSDFIDELKLNPSFSTFALLRHTKKGRTSIAIYEAQKTDVLRKVLYTKNAHFTAMAYSRDARQLAVAADDKTITFYNPVTNAIIKSYNSALSPSKMEYSDNNYFLAAADDRTLEIWNLERDAVRKTITVESPINDFIFTGGSERLLVLRKDGKMDVYDTKTFDLQQTIDDLGNAIACSSNDNGKYAAVVKNDSCITVVNLLDPTERRFFADASGNIKDVRMIYNSIQEKDYLIYNDVSNIVYHQIGKLPPYYNKMMTTMLNTRLKQWMNRMEGESLEAYNERVNDATRRAQIKNLECELATEMAAGLIDESEVTIGKYNTATRMLAVSLNNMPDIYLEVPMADLEAFDDNVKLAFRNVKYGLNPDDKFEVVYAEVVNTKNGKVYIFDNMERKSFALMDEGENLVSLDILKLSNMEETALMSIKDDVMALAKREQTISDKTHITVNTEAVPAVSADGKNIINYNVGFTYEVEEEFSARDDFKPGHYHTDESKAAMLMLQIMKQAFEKDFAKYMVEGKRVKIRIKGTADASPINRALNYDGSYGEYTEEPIYKSGELSNITLEKKGGIADNDQLAFARAIGVQHWITKELTSFENMSCDYEYHIEVSKEEGSKYRRISVQYTFIDAF